MEITHDVTRIYLSAAAVINYNYWFLAMLQFTSGTSWYSIGWRLLIGNWIVHYNKVGKGCRLSPSNVDVH